MSQHELYHHGIDGQRWGVRHGPPYPLDRADHNKVVEKSEKASKKRHLSYSGSRKYAKRMTDKDLNDTIDRLQREETYRRLVSREKAEKKAAKAAKKAKKEEKIRYENQNELAKKQQELQRDQFEQQKKANRITHKVIENLLTKAASTIGTQATKHLVENYFGKENKDNINIKPEEKKDNTTPRGKEIEKEIEQLEKRKSEVESRSESLIIPSNMKFVGGDWIDSEDFVNSRLVELDRY